MRRLEILATCAALLIAACASGGGDSAAPTSAAPSGEVGEELGSAEPPRTSAPEASVADGQDGGPESEESAAGDPGDAQSDAEVLHDEDEVTTEVLVIDGPASVRRSCASLRPGVSNFSLDAGGGAHDVRIFVPETASSDPAPVVLNWHGLGSNGEEQAAFTGYETLAGAQGFVVVHATGLAVDGRNSWELVQFDSDERDDLAFADALIDTVVEEWCGDPDRVYSTGMSNGGLFTSELVCNRSTRIAAAASVAGTTHAPTCEPERAVPYIAFHGTADDVVPFDDDDSSTLLPPAAADSLIDDSTPQEFAEFAADAGCEGEPARVAESAEVIRYDYVGCDDDVPMAFYEIVGGGHTWPSSPLSEQLEGFGMFTQDVDATVDAWAFMSQFSL